MPLTTEQIEKLSAKLDASRVLARQGAGGMALSYIASWDAIRLANDIFGFAGWSSETLEATCVFAEMIDKKWQVSYTARTQVTIYGSDGARLASYTDVGAGHGKDFSAGMAHESAIKEAASDAEKRALRHLGMPFGLALYDKTQEFVETPAPAPPASAVSQEEKDWARTTIGAALDHVKELCVMSGVSFSKIRAEGYKRGIYDLDGVKNLIITLGRENV